MQVVSEGALGNGWWRERPALLQSHLPAHGLIAPWQVWVGGTGDGVGVGQSVSLSYTTDCVRHGESVLGKVDGRAGFLPNHNTCALQEIGRPGSAGSAQTPGR